jgi:3-oxoacyl-[acyl-carrier protein] reductase
MGNRVAVVTGGSRGIGKEICLALAKNGYDIVTCYAKSADAAMQTVAECKAFGVNADAFCADVADSESVAHFFEQVKENFGTVDVLVNNAGITRDTLLLRMSEEDFTQVLDTNLKGAFLCTKEAAKLMLKHKSGRIISISSVVGLRGNAGQANYAASKAGLIGFTKSVARELGGKGITANAIAPGFIRTEMTDQLPEEMQKSYEAQIPRKRFGTGADVAAAVCFLASEQADYITGQVLAVDGGMSM